MATHDPLLDPDLADPQASQLRAARAGGDLQSTFEALRAAAAPWDRRWFLLTRLAASIPRALFDQLVAAHPAEPVAYLMRGTHAIMWGWQARGSGTNETVGQDAQRLLKERLQLAEADLRHAAALDPSDPNPWSRLLAVGIGLGWDRATIEHAFEQVRLIAPDFMPAYRRMLQYHCAKWYGSDEQMFAFARASAQGAPSGSELHSLLIEAHMERFLAIDREHSFDDARAYASQVRNEVLHARATSVGSPHFERREWSYLPHQLLVEWWYFSHDRRSLTDELNTLGPRIDPGAFGGGERAAKYLGKIRRYAADTEAKERRAGKQRKSKRGTVWGLIAVAVITGVSILAGLATAANAYLQPRMYDRVWVRNSSAAMVSVTIDGGSEQTLSAWQSHRYDLDPGRHTVRATVIETGAVIDEGTFTMPARHMLGLYGHVALYDLTGTARYAAAWVTYDGEPARVEDLGMDEHFVVFPEGIAALRSRFPSSADRNAELTGVCARAEDRSLSCLD